MDGDSDNHLNISPSRAESNAAGPSDDLGGSQSSKQNGSHSKYSNGPHIRSRITVVCAECKRLKLKCDRRTPCSSCLKRDTVQRCIYSQAATEKIDVQSLHNRLLVVEGTLAQLSSASPSTSISNAFANMPPFKSSYPGAAQFTHSSGPQSAFAQVASGSFNNASSSHSSGSGMASNEHALLALGASGSAVVFSMEDVSSIWLSELNLTPGNDGGRSSLAAFGVQSGRSGNGGKPTVKLEPTAMLLPSTPPSSGPPSAYGSTSPPGPATIRFSPSPAFIPPIPYEKFLPSSSRSTPYCAEIPQVTPELLAYLPSTQLTRIRLTQALTDVIALHPCFNVRHFTHRIEAMITWGQSPDPQQPFDTGPPTVKSKLDLARELFQPEKQRREPVIAGSSASPKPTLSFFAATAAAFALSALVSKDGNGEQHGRPGTGDSGISHPGMTASVSRETNPNPAVLFALSEQSLDLFEKTSPYDVDSLVAMILQVLYQLHDGQPRIAQKVFPLVGKMINIARTMGLPIDPDEFPGTFSLFEAEARRRVWWDIFYFDVFVSDCMGHPTLIADHTFNTKLPAEVDEETFSPSSTSLPVPTSDEHCENTSAYMVLKCRLAQLMKSVKKQTSRESHTDDVLELSIDQAATVETEITNWLADLPPRYRLDMSTTDSSHHHHHYSAGSGASSSTPPMLISQRCELVMIANRMILKLYLPFLRDANGHGPNKPSHQTVLGTINAAHSISHAARVLHSACQETRPALFDYYDFGRGLFDAAIVCAHATLQQPTSILAAEAMKCVDESLEIMREWGLFKYAAEGSLEGLRIIELMKQKAEIARGNSGDDGSGNAGTKRKRTEFEDDTLDDGFQLPFIGASVTSVRTDQAKPMLVPSRPTVPSSKDSGKSSKDKVRYPTIGIRSRPGQARPNNRQRTGSIPPSPVDAINPHAVTTTMVEPQMVGHQQHQRQAQSAVGPTMGVPVEAPMSSLPYSTHSSPAETPAVVAAAVQQNAFNPGFASHEDPQFIDQRRYSHNSSGQSTGFEQHTASSSPYSPTHQHLPYHASQGNEGYYMPYTGPGGPQQMYDAAPGVSSHPQEMTMSDYANHGPPTTIETPPNASHDQSPYGIPHERHANPSYPAYIQKTDIAPAPTPYQQSANHSMQVTPIHGWVHANPSNPEMWSSHPKYMGGMGSG
ncbi:hypothetical protein QCA50_013183 [Cerrena zonata]|uniref:Zn(2)-C6 fungal-type domain-containing protein n=1 Tax=Cerrena zonata TaxID=2478898 RepID=A0AAW0FWW1_9APHY